MMYCYLNGQIMPTDNASIKLNDLGLLRGYGMFDYFRTYNSQPFKWDWYWQRFEQSAHTLSLKLLLTQTEAAAIVSELLQLSGQVDAAFRFVLTGGYSPDSVRVIEPNLAIICENLRTENAVLYEKGIKILPFEFVRDLPEIKTTNYLNMIRLAAEMQSQNASDLLYFKDGEVSELTRSNFFIFKGDTLITPNRHILQGITRRVVLGLATAHFKVEVRPLLYSELAEADEAFTTSSIKWVLPIVQIGRQLIGDGAVGHRSKLLLELFKKETELL
jgi:branched-chain amino acid aminotransferase